VIGMDSLESYDVVLNYKMKLLSLRYDLGQSRVIVGRNQGGALEIYFFPTTTKEHAQGM
jgi:hypothetical protein